MSPGCNNLYFIIITWSFFLFFRFLRFCLLRPNTIQYKTVIISLFINLPWPGDSERSCQFSHQVATCLPVYLTRWRLHTVPFHAEHHKKALLKVFGLIRSGIEPESTILVTGALSTRLLIFFLIWDRTQLYS